MDPYRFYFAPQAQGTSCKKFLKNLQELLYANAEAFGIIKTN